MAEHEPGLPVEAKNPEAGGVAGAPTPLEHFAAMVDRCYDYAEAAKARGKPIVGILCEFTPREILLAAGAVPICLCGGSAGTIPAAEQELPTNVCPLIKSTFGYHLLGRNPFLQWADLVVAETTCDGKKKMYELMGESKPMAVLELPQKSGSTAGLEHWTDELRRLRARLEKEFSVAITDDRLREAIRLMNRERRCRRELADLMALDPPPLTGRELLEFKSLISGLEPDLREYEKAAAWSRARGRRPARPEVRVLLTGVPIVHGAERVLELIEAAGAVVVCQENCTGLKPILEDVDPLEPDPLLAIARKYYHLPCSVMTPNPARFDTLRRLAAQFRPQCVVELVWQACLTYDIESARVRRLVEEELRLPYLKITTDYSPADSARITARMEALVEMVRDRAAPPPAG